MKIAVLGAGNVGKALGEALAARGHGRHSVHKAARHRNWAPTFCPPTALGSSGIPGDLLPCILLRTQQQTCAPQVHTVASPTNGV